MAVSPGKITDRIAMLGEGGVGKTSLTINVRSQDLLSHYLLYLFTFALLDQIFLLRNLPCHHKLPPPLLCKPCSRAKD